MNVNPGTYQLGPSDGSVSDGRLTGHMTVVQLEFGIKPFSAMMGALKVKDEVEINLDVALPVA